VWVVAGAVLVPMAAAVSPRILEVNAKVSHLLLPAEATIDARAALFRMDPGEHPVGALSLEGGDVHVVQYWVNATELVDPISGGVLVHQFKPVAWSDVPLSPNRIEFLHPTDEPDVRLVAASALGLTFASPGDVRANASAARDAIGPSRANDAARQPTLGAFDRPPTASGWLEFEASTITGPGEVSLLIDGWGVRLQDDEHSMDVHTGSTQEHEHGFGNGGHADATYTFLVIRAHDARLVLPAGTHLEGFAPAPQISWDGPAHLELYSGDVDVGQARVPITQREMTIEGKFRSDLEFAPDSAFAGASLRAAGVGVASIALPQAAGLAPSQQMGVWASVAVGALAVSVLGVQTYRGPRRARIAPPPTSPLVGPPAPEILDLGQLIERAQKQPLDGELQFRLGVELFRVGRPDVGLRAIDRSFRLHPPAVVRLLEDPELASIRDSHEIRQLLGRFQREQHRKVWAGYA